MINPEVKQMLVRFIESHGVTVLGTTENQIQVQAVYSRQVTPAERYDTEPGKLRVVSFTQPESIPATWSHVRDWLGY